MDDIKADSSANF